MKILFIALLLILSFTATAQTTTTTVWYNTAITSGVDSASWSSVYKAYYYEITEANRPQIDTADLQNDLVQDLIDGGYYTSNVELLYFLANKTEEAAETNVTIPGTYDLVETGAGSLTFTPYQGYAGDGTNYFDSNFDPSTDCLYASQNDFTIAVYTRTQSVNETTGVAGNSVNTMRLFPYYSGSMYGRINVATSLSASVGNSDGFFGVTRTSSTNMEMFRNNSSVTSTSSSTSSSPSAVDLFFLASDGSAGSNNEISFILVTTGLTLTQWQAINTIVETYMDGINKGVQ